VNHETLPFPSDVPNLELIRRSGWNVGTARGIYAVAWRGREEVLLVWRDGAWERTAGKGDYRDAA
jgi:hypothetical protein